MENVLIVPGLRGSGPAHWQSWLHEALPGSRRVEQVDNTTPDLEIWAARVAQAIAARPEPVWIVAHSFGCLATIRALANAPEQVAGALLVAPADPEKFGLSLPDRRLTVPAILAASRNDPWLTLEKARRMAQTLTASFLDLGLAGHVNTESGYGAWPQGLSLLHSLQEAVIA